MYICARAYNIVQRLFLQGLGYFHTRVAGPRARNSAVHVERRADARRRTNFLSAFGLADRDLCLRATG